jgi:hypothetical protein
MARVVPPCASDDGEDKEDDHWNGDAHGGRVARTLAAGKRKPHTALKKTKRPNWKPSGAF